MPLNIEYGVTGERCFLFRHKENVVAKHCDFISMFHEDFYNITIIPCGNGIEIERFETYQTGIGIGSYLMMIFNEISLRLEMPLYLIPGIPGYGDTYRNDMNPKRQRDFYHKHGFKRSASSLYWQNTAANKIDKTDICLGKK